MRCSNRKKNREIQLIENKDARESVEVMCAAECAGQLPQHHDQRNHIIKIILLVHVVVVNKARSVLHVYLLSTDFHPRTKTVL